MRKAVLQAEPAAAQNGLILTREAGLLERQVQENVMAGLV